VAFSRDGATLASGSPGPGIPGYQVQQWDVASRRATIRHFTDFPVHAVAFSRDGDILALAGGGSYTVQLWDLAAGKKIPPSTATRASSTGLRSAPTGKTLASASDDKTVRLWDVATGGSVTVLRGHTSAVASVAFSPDGKALASASYDYTVRLWDLAAERTTVIFRGHLFYVNSVAFSADGTMLASGGYDYTVRLWEIPS
jgi:WD40 repeat protein